MNDTQAVIESACQKQAKSFSRNAFIKNLDTHLSALQGVEKEAESLKEIKIDNIFFMHHIMMTKRRYC